MKMLKVLACAMPAWGVLLTGAVALHASTPARPAGPPEIERVDRRFLTQLARRTIEARFRDGEPYQPGYVPPSLRSVECQIVVTLRQHGYERGTGISTLKPVIDACQEAAHLALVSSGVNASGEPDFLDNVRVEMQVVGPPTPYESVKNWTEPGALEGFIDPGLDGVRIFLDGEHRWFTPGEMISNNVPLDEAMRTLAKEITLNPDVLDEAMLSKFRTLHWWEVDEEGHVASLRRGMVTLGPDIVTRENVGDAIERLIRYLMYRQRPDGRFTYVYNPATDEYGSVRNEAAQSGAAWALAVATTHSGSGTIRDAADRAIRARLEQMIDLPHVENAAFIASPDRRNTLDITAETCLALADFVHPERYAEQRRRLVRAMLWLQKDDGHFMTSFPPVPVLEPQGRVPGEALLALARAYELSPSAEIFGAFRRAHAFYEPYFAKTGSAAMAPWHTQAFAVMARMAKKREYADYVFRMSDAICDHQLTRDNCTSPEMWGAIATPALPPSATTAAFVAGVVDAAELAEQFGEAERARRYREAALLGARWIMQLQFRPEECYYVHSPHEAVDGIRTSPTNVTIRLDSCQHALIALIKVHQILARDRS